MPYYPEEYERPDGPNRSLPPISPWRARSTYALILTVQAALAPLVPGLRDLLGETVTPDGQAQALDGIDRIIAALDEIALVIGPVWLWIERRAPWRRISLRGH